MTNIVLIVIGIIFVMLCLIILIRTLRFKPEKVSANEGEKIKVNRDKIVQDMVDMIRCKTVSYRDENLIDRGEFDKFVNLLKERFPNIHNVAELKLIGKTGLLYKIKGKSDLKPTVCMAHYDVVPVDESMWTKPAFDGLIEGDFIWGRGTMDTKGTLCAIFEALEQLLEEDYKPNNDLYLSFSGEEEIDGNSCPEIVKYLKQNNIKPAIVLDEGGAIVENTFPGVSRESAMIGIAEKGSVNINFEINSEGGHSSTPPKKTALGELSRAVTKIESKPFKRQLTKPVKEMFDVMGRNSTFFYRMIFANLWCFLPLLDLICKRTGGELNAMMRTTVAVTRMNGSKSYNVFPAKASFGVNMRLLGNDTIDSAIKYLRKVISNDKIKVELVNGMNASIYSDTSCEEWEKLKDVIHATWPDIIVSPYLMMACSDSRHYCEISDRVYRFSAMKMSKEERLMIHGNDERIPISTLIKTVEFYERFLKQM